MPQKSHINAQCRHLLALLLCLGFYSVQAQENPSLNTSDAGSSILSLVTTLIKR